MFNNVRELQTFLAGQGFPSGPVDGEMGPLTAAAFRDWVQGQTGVPFEVSTRGGKLTLTGPRVEIEPSDHPLPWLAYAYGALGLHETRDNAALKAFLRSDGPTLGDPSELPWCGDFAETCVKLGLPTEPFDGRVGRNPYLARNWTDFGVPVGPSLGAICFFWRGTRHGTAGHVGFAVGQDEHRVFVLGGNQGNAVTVAPLSKERLLGYRWPRTSPFQPTPLPRMTAPGQATSTNEA